MANGADLVREVRERLGSLGYSGLKESAESLAPGVVYGISSAESSGSIFSFYASDVSAMLVLRMAFLLNGKHDANKIKRMIVRISKHTKLELSRSVNYLDVNGKIHSEVPDQPLAVILSCEFFENRPCHILKDSSSIVALLNNVINVCDFVAEDCEFTFIPVMK